VQIETKLQLKSAHAKYHDEEPYVWEGPDFFIVCAKLRFSKPTYRKLKFLSDLHDEPFVQTLTDMIQHELKGEIVNTEELGNRIRQRILEEAHNLGNESPSDRKPIIEALES